MGTVFLDLDGTLTDPKPGITRSIRHALHALDREAPDEDALTWCIGPPLRQSFVTLLMARRKPTGHWPCTANGFRCRALREPGL